MNNEKLFYYLEDEKMRRSKMNNYISLAEKMIVNDKNIQFLHIYIFSRRVDKLLYAEVEEYNISS